MVKPVSPSEVALDYLLDLMKKEPGISANDIIRKAELESDELILDTIFGAEPVTEATAIALESVFGRPAHFWMNLQENYDRDTRANEIMLEELKALNKD